MRDGWDGLHSVLKCLRESSFEALLPRPRRILPRLLSLVGEEAREGDNKVARHRMNGIQPILSFGLPTPDLSYFFSLLKRAGVNQRDGVI